MNRIRRPKVITTSFRPPSAGGTSPLERNARPGAAACSNAAWDTLNKRRRAEDAEHDRWLAGLSIDAVLGAFQSLSAQKPLSPKNSDEWWIVKRHAALARRILKFQAARG